MAEPVDYSRRAFLAGKVADTAVKAPLGPTPPWLGGRISPESCLSCGQPCVDACPEEIIRIHPPDHPEAGMAYLEFDEGPCTFCRACVEACPASLGMVTTGRALPSVALDKRRCLAAQGVVCVICVALCPERALVGEPGGLVTLAEDRCTGCGACIPACPVSALDVHDISLQDTRVV